MPRKRSVPAQEAQAEVEGVLNVEQPKVQSAAPKSDLQPKSVEERDGVVIQHF